MLIITRRSVAVGGRLKLPSPLHTIINNLQLCSENVVFCFFLFFAVIKPLKSRCHKNR